MQCIVLIFTIILSFVFGGGEGGNVCDSNLHCICEVAKYSLSDATSCATNDNTCIKDATTHPEEKGSILADGNDLAVLLGSANPGRRTQPSIKTSFRTINAVKAKVFDRNNLYIFQFFYLHFKYRLSSDSKYLYIICQLLI